jgi:hydroxymethylglutaryl-CoA synthase
VCSRFQYPLVDGKLSQVCYLQALDGKSCHVKIRTAAALRHSRTVCVCARAACYAQALRKHGVLQRHTNAQPLTVSDVFQHMVFHSPYNKLVQQSFQRILYNDARRLAQVGVL